ncbi:MAG: hypothetical protein KDN19_08880, partial [Verrucomicrobiae bacterium]|nr:hypothetical protein [Verrucomicrobiae bacterium]
FSSRVQSAAIARTWQQEETPYATLDLREMLSGGFPSPEAMPRLVIVASSFNSYHSLDSRALDRNLQAYLDAGGRVLWITGTGQPPTKTFADFRETMERSATNAKLPVPEKDFIGAQLSFFDSQDSPAPRVVRSPLTKAGWQQPFSPWEFEPENGDGFRTVLELNVGGDTLIVGIVDELGQRLVLPIYAVTPFLLAGEDRVESPHEPTLDAASTAVLDAALNALRPMEP